MMNNTTTNTKALVNETLSKDDVMSLFDMTLTRNGEVDNHVSFYKGTFTTWCGDIHEGYIVCHDTIDASDKHQEEYYFMEVTLEEIDNMERSYHLWKPTFHMLMPITENYKRKPVLPEKGNTKDLCSYIIANAYRDEWDYVYVPMTEQEIKKYGYNRNAKTIVPLTYNDIMYNWETPLTEEEQAQRQAAKKAKEKELIDLFNNSKLPEPESDPWYGILSMGYGTENYDLECKVIKMLKNRGYNVRIDGERDSFGWVTRGIFIDAQIMAIY